MLVFVNAFILSFSTVVGTLYSTGKVVDILDKKSGALIIINSKHPVIVLYQCAVTAIHFVKC